MNATIATCLEPAASNSGRLRPYLVPSRVAYHHPITNHERLQAEMAAEQIEQPAAPSNQGFGLPDTRHGGPHPGDIVYWVACLGGAGLLLLCTIH
jgi:hypothetical protein